MEYQYLSFVIRIQWVGFFCFILHEMCQNVLLGVKIDGSLDVATFEFVWISTIDYGEWFNQISVSAIENVDQHMTGDWFEISMLEISGEQGKNVCFAEITN